MEVDESYFCAKRHRGYHGKLKRGRGMESRYRYSVSIVYNNFPWPEPSDTQRQAIESAAQAVLDACVQPPNYDWVERSIVWDIFALIDSINRPGAYQVLTADCGYAPDVYIEERALVSHPDNNTMV